MFGGQVIAQALQAAQATVGDGKEAHSMHAYFLRGGKEGPVTTLDVAADFDGRSFSNRRVVASQLEEDGTSRPILNLTASFQKPEPGLEHDDYQMPDVPQPEDLRPDMELRREYAVQRQGAWQKLDGEIAVRRGELVRVDLFLSLPAARNFVVVDDPVPGGLEPVNRDLANASSVDAAHGGYLAAGGSWWFRYGDWVKDGIAIDF